jgi:hypothetical protein
MPRRNVPARRSAPAAAGQQNPGERSFGERIETWRGEDYRVRPVPGSQSDYRCPGCDQVLTAGRGHIVAWPADDPEAADRRHWHSSCWSAREQRQPGVIRSRNAPRYG